MSTAPHSCERANYKFEHVDAVAKRQLDFLAMAATNQNYSIEEDMFRLQKMVELLPELAAVYHKMDATARGKGGPRTDARFRLIAIHLVTAWEMATGEPPKLWRNTADEPDGDFWDFAIHACRHFLPDTEIAEATLYEACHWQIRH
jgi:hypothetical protein